jgi:hypothetical protein
MVFWIVGQEQQNIQRGLGQMISLTQGMTGQLVGLIELLGELQAGNHGIATFLRIRCFKNELFKFELIIARPIKMSRDFSLTL